MPDVDLVLARATSSRDRRRRRAPIEDTSTGPVSPFQLLENIPAVCEDVAPARSRVSDVIEEKSAAIAVKYCPMPCLSVLLGQIVLYRQEDGLPLLHLAVEAI